MEARNPPVKNNRTVLAAVLAAALLAGSGCVALDNLLPKTDAPPTGQVCQIVAAWNKEVMTAPDTVNGGRPLPGLTGRLYLFGTQIDYPLAGDGNLIVELYAPTPPAPNAARPDAPATPTAPAEPQRIERWELDKDTLHKLLRKDPIGWGYTLFLPWATYRPDLTQVKLRVCYIPRGGTPLYVDSPLTLARARLN